MMKRFTSALMVLLLVGTLANGAGFRRGGRECAMQGMHDCCKKALLHARTLEATAARLCCLVNCPQPAPTGTNFTFRSSSDLTADTRPTTARAPSLPSFDATRDYSPPFQPSHSPPAYI